MKKLFILTLVSLMLILTFSGCKNTSTGTDDTTNTDNGDTNMMALIKDDGSSDYKIIYQKNSKHKSDATELKANIYGVAGINLFPKTDEETEISDYEILIGNTNRPESTDILKDIVDGYYGIKVYGNKIVINSADDNGISAAIRAFSSLYITDANKNISIPKDLAIFDKIPEDSSSDSNKTDPSKNWKLKTFTATNGTTLPYQLYLPKNMDPTKEYPVFIYMHGLGSVGTTGNHIYSTVANILRVVENSAYKDDVIMIAPQHAKGQSWVDVDYKPGTYTYDNTPISKCLEAAKELFDKCFDELPVDTSRVYGYGGSMGAFSLFYLATMYPDFFAAIVPVAGGCDPTKASVLKDLPMWVIHGDADKAVNIVGSKTMVENIQALGGTNAKLTVLKGIGHHSTKCFSNAAETPGLIDWIFSQKKA